MQSYKSALHCLRSAVVVIALHREVLKICFACTKHPSVDWTSCVESALLHGVSHLRIVNFRLVYDTTLRDFIRLYASDPPKGCIKCSLGHSTLRSIVSHGTSPLTETTCQEPTCYSLVLSLSTALYALALCPAVYMPAIALAQRASSHG